MYQIISTKQASNPTLDELKQRLRIEHNLHDKMLADALVAAMEFAEKFTNLALREHVISFTAQKTQNKILLPLLPIIKINEILIDGKKISEDRYKIINCEIISFNTTYQQNSPCQITYECGFKLAKIPLSIKQGILLHASLLYENPLEHNKHLDDVLNFYKFFRRLNV